VRLPSLRKLSKLVYLNLEHCKLLESFPQLPSSPIIGREREENEYFFTTGLFIFNCPKLGVKERYSSMTFSWMTQFIQAYQHSYPASLFDGLHIVTPGNEIPSWINNQIMGASISIDESPIINDNNNNIIGFLSCAVFSIASYHGLLAYLQLVLESCTDSKKRCMTIPISLRNHLIRTKSSHLWIKYTASCDDFIKIDSLDKIHFFGINCLGLEVKSCGYRWVRKQDLQEFNLTILNQENSLAQKCKIMAIEDATQPEPEQESFISQVITTS